MVERIEGIGQVLSSDTVFRYLGYPFHPKCHPLPVTYFNFFLDVLQKTITAWQKRNLTLPGRVLVLNSRLLSKLWYLGYLVSFPEWFFKKLLSLLRAFIWQGRKPQINLDILFTAQSNGGLGLINPRNQIIVIKGWWMQQYIIFREEDWVQLSLYVCRYRYLPEPWGLSLFSTKARPSQLRFKGLWLDIYTAWRKLGGELPEDMDPVAALGDWDLLDNATLASVPLPSYKIKSGHLFLQGLQYPLHGHSK